MNDPHRSGNWQSFARTAFAASVPVYGGRTERKGLGKGRIGAFLAIFCSFTAVGVMTGCNNSHTIPTPQTQTPFISVRYTQPPPTSMLTGSSVSLAANVINDPARAGVDWVATCTPVTLGSSTPNCGTFTPNHTASGDPAIYTAPTAVPAKNNAVLITALPTTDRSKGNAVWVNITSAVTGIAITTPLPGSVPSGAVLTFGATVYGDPANLGTDWSVTCLTPDGPGDCGSGFHSQAGATTSFTVPQTVNDPVTNQQLSVVGSTMTITAFAAADHTKFAMYGPMPVTSPISISITQQLPATMLTGATAQVTAVVANDTTNAGVTWSVHCSPAPCGSVTPAQTASGVAATYTAPATVPSPNPPPGLTVTILVTANATINPTQNTAPVQTTVTVNIVAPISVSITKKANTTIVANRTASLVATVSNDFSNAGVDWTVSCGSPGACGTFSPAHTASGAPTTYTAPSAPPSGNTVTITATSTADPTKSDQQQNITVISAPPPNSLLSGQFVLFLSARNSRNGAFNLGGVISGDGNGTITGGSFDIADATGNFAASSSFRVAAASPYSIGPDGRGQITMTLNTGAVGLTNFGVPVPSTNPATSTLTLSVVFVTPQHALLTETDAFGDATGTLDFQNTTDLASFTGLNGTYSLQLLGTQVGTGTPGFLVAAAITSQFSNFQTTFTGFTADQSANGAIASVPFTVSSQTFFSFFSHSTGEIQLNSVNLGLPRTLSLDLWLIDANHFVVTDFVDSQFGVLVGGNLTAQPASPSLSGTLAFTEAGANTAASATTPGQPQVAGGILTCSSAGSIDVASLGGTALTGQAVSATCGAPASGRALITITGAGSSGISQFAAYPTIDGSFYLLELDGGAAGTSGPSGAGVAYPQKVAPPVSASALSGTYASQFSGSTALGSQAFAGRVISDGTSTISGTADVNSFNTTSPASGSPSLGATVSGSYTAGVGGIGAFRLTFTITPAAGQPAPQIPTLNPACYIVDANTCLLLGLDTSAPGVGIVQLQNTGL